MGICLNEATSLMDMIVLSFISPLFCMSFTVMMAMTLLAAC